MHDSTLSYDAASKALEELDIKEFEIDLIDSGSASLEAPTTPLCCVTVAITIISISATAYNGCIVAG